MYTFAKHGGVMNTKIVAMIKSIRDTIHLHEFGFIGYFDYYNSITISACNT